MKKTIPLLALLLSVPALAAEQVPTKTYILTEEQAADYARRLSAENEQISRQFQANAATLQSLQAQAVKTESKALPKN